VECLSDLAQAFAFGSIFDFARDAQMATFGHQHHIASGQGEAGGDACALGAAWRLDDLHQNLLPDFEQLADVAFAQFGALDRGGRFVPFRHLRDDVAHIEKGIPFQPDIDEGGIHPRQHILHHTFIDVAHDALPTLEAHLHQLPVLQHRHARLTRRYIHQNLPHNRLACDGRSLRLRVYLLPKVR
jgi:hypothetical protein